MLSMDLSARGKSKHSQDGRALVLGEDASPRVTLRALSTRVHVLSLLRLPRYNKSMSRRTPKNLGTKLELRPKIAMTPDPTEPRRLRGLVSEPPLIGTNLRAAVSSHTRPPRPTSHRMLTPRTRGRLVSWLPMGSVARHFPARLFTAGSVLGAASRRRRIVGRVGRCPGAVLCWSAWPHLSCPSRGRRGIGIGWASGAAVASG